MGRPKLCLSKSRADVRTGTQKGDRDVADAYNSNGRTYIRHQYVESASLPRKRAYVTSGRSITLPCDGL